MDKFLAVKEGRHVPFRLYLLGGASMLQQMVREKQVGFAARYGFAPRAPYQPVSPAFLNLVRF